MAWRCAISLQATYHGLLQSMWCPAGLHGWGMLWCSRTPRPIAQHCSNLHLMPRSLTHACCSASQSGGAVYDQDTVATAIISNTTFTTNAAVQGANVAIRNGNTKLRQNLGNPDSDVAVLSTADSGSSSSSGSGSGSADYSDYAG